MIIIVNVVKKQIVIILSIVIFFIVIFNIYYLFNIRLLKNEYSKISDNALIEVDNNDMSPALKKGDLVIINTQDYNYKIGDVVAYYNGSNYAVNRIITISNSEAVIKADNSSSVDKVYLDKIIGKYSSKVAFVGNIFLALKNTSVSILIIVILVIICVLLSLNGFEESENKKEKEFEERMLRKDLDQ